MNKIFIETGSFNKYIPLSQIKNGKYKISWELEEINSGMYKWKYTIVDSKPSLSFVKTLIEDSINNDIKNVIVNGFYWNDMHIYLTVEHQLDYKLLYDSTMILDGTNLPENARFEVNGKPIIYKFKSIDDLQDFILCMNEHIRKCINAGYERKEKIISLVLK